MAECIGQLLCGCICELLTECAREIGRDMCQDVCCRSETGCCCEAQPIPRAVYERSRLLPINSEDTNPAEEVNDGIWCFICGKIGHAPVFCPSDPNSCLYTKKSSPELKINLQKPLPT